MTHRKGTFLSKKNLNTICFSILFPPFPLKYHLLFLMLQRAKQKVKNQTTTHKNNNKILQSSAIHSTWQGHWPMPGKVEVQWDIRSMNVMMSPLHSGYLTSDFISMRRKEDPTLFVSQLRKIFCLHS